MNRRTFALGSLAALSQILVPGLAAANVPGPYDWTAVPPMDARQAFIDWMVKNRGEEPTYLDERFDRFQQLLQHRDLYTDGDKRAFLFTPREEFCTKANLPRVYDRAFLDIGYGVTISGPNLVGRMTSALAVKFGEKVLEIGTGSGYQSAYLANLTDKVWSIEIIRPLSERTRAIYDSLIARGYSEYGSITTKNADGYYGWEDAAPFDKIIVTCGIDPDRHARGAARSEGGGAGGCRGQRHGGALRHLRRLDRAVRAIHKAGRRCHQGDAQSVERAPDVAVSSGSPIWKRAVHEKRLRQG